MKNLINGWGASLFDPDKPAARVVVFGAVGGGLGVMAGCVLGELTGEWYIVLLPSIALGAGAAFAAVFVLMGIKTEDVLRCCGVALLAGFFWRPVFDAGKDYLLNAPERAAEAQAVETAKDLDTTVAKLLDSPNNTNLIQHAGVLAENLTRDTADLRRSRVRIRAQSSVTRAVDVLGKHADKGQPVAAAAVTGVGEAAINSGNRTVAEKVGSELARIPMTNNPLLEARKKEIMIRAGPLR